MGLEAVTENPSKILFIVIHICSIFIVCKYAIVMQINVLSVRAIAVFVIVQRNVLSAQRLFLW